MKATIDIARKHSMVAATQTVFGGAKAGRQMAKKQNQVALCYLQISHNST